MSEKYNNFGNYDSSDKFLKDVAKYYATNPLDLSKGQMLMLFPNKRSLTFMRMYVNEGFGKGFGDKKMKGYMPAYKTGTAFLEMITGMKETKGPELLFVLYKAYTNVFDKVCREKRIQDAKCLTMDSFVFLGDILLNDFNEIDSQLADAKVLFENLRRYREIKSNFLTDEQKKVVEYLFGDVRGLDDGTDDLWQHYKGDDGVNVKRDDKCDNHIIKKFVALTEILGELYVEFRRLLQENGMAYPGMIHRAAAEKLRDEGMPADFKYKHMAFVGFDNVSLAMITVMKWLKEHGMADFFWDKLDNIHYVSDRSKSLLGRALSRVNQLSRKLKSPEGFDEIVKETANSSSHKMAEVTIVSTPSNYMQAKIVGNTINQWREENNGNFRPAAPDNTAIVLPDSRVLLPLLSALPTDNNNIDINITMGLSPRETPVATLIRSIMTMLLRNVGSQSAENKDRVLFRDDVLTVISHPTLLSIAPAACKSINDKLSEDRSYVIKSEIIEEYAGNLSFLFKVSKDSTKLEEVSSYFKQLIEGLRDLMPQVADCDGAEPGKNRPKLIEREVLNKYSERVDQICDLIGKYNVKLKENVFYSLLERLVNVDKINFTGMPVRGLQVLGLLETRAIDFKNVIIMSMNERIFPKKNYIRSFIPVNFRSMCGMTTPAQAESEYAYHFYHLLNRSERVLLLFDSRDIGQSAGEQSRYITQLKSIYPVEHIKVLKPQVTSHTEPPRSISIAKDDEIMAILDRYRTQDDNRLYLSASALKTYRACRLKFFLKYVLKLPENNEEVDYIESITSGNIFHKAMEDLFNDYKGQEITVDILQNMIRNGNIEEKVRLLVCDMQYNGNSKYKAYPYCMPEEGKIYTNVFADLIKDVLNAEIAVLKTGRVRYKFIGAEVSNVKEFKEKEGPKTQRDLDSVVWKIDDDLTVNFNVVIDRKDQYINSDGTDGNLKFIDYKTGSDDNKFCSVDDLFSQESKLSRDAIFQLLTYAWFEYDHMDKGKEVDIVPQIYRVKLIKKDPDFGVYLNKGRGKKSLLEDHFSWEGKGSPELSDFKSQLFEMIKEIFNPEVPFNQTSCEDNCAHCQFNNLCNRVVAQKSY